MKRKQIGALLLVSGILSLVAWQGDNFIARRLDSTPLMGVQRFFYRAGRDLHDGIKMMVSMPKIYSENKELKNELSQLYTLKIEKNHLAYENAALKNQLGVLGESIVRLLPVQVLGQPITRQGRLLIIDKGRLEQVKVGQTVLVNDQLVGYVILIEDHLAQVRPIFSPESEIPANIWHGEHRIWGKVKGDNERIWLREVLLEESISVGDLVVSSGQESVFPSRLLIGRVVSVERHENDLYQSARLEAFWQPNQLQVVFVQMD